MTRQCLFPLLVVALASACRSPNPFELPPGHGDDDDDGTSDESGEPTPTTSSTSAATSADTTGADVGTTGDDGSDDGDSASTGTDDGSTGSTDDGPLACTGTCVSAPVGWNGPVVLRIDEHDSPSCADPAYDQLAVEGYGDVIAPEAQCGCDCTVGEEVECAATLTSFTSNSCFAVEESWDLHTGCNVIGSPAGYFEIDYDASGGACDPSPTVEIGPFDVTDYRAACSTTAMAEGVCDGDATCVPAPADAARLCWWSDGDVPCPDMLAGTREVIYTDDAIDDRGCDECSCNPVSGSCEESVAYLVATSPACQLNPGGFSAIVEGDCSSSGVVQSLLLGAPVAATTCTAAGRPAANGSVEPQGPITVCCAG
ncbi:MAG TPA: hypothetical protein VG755_41020 [Nannocystaceae bacterium]|nr:hypothetical protein [Nannocystaceae bacterium]